MPTPPNTVLDMSTGLARELIDAGYEAAVSRGVSLAFVVVDRSGTVVASLRSDGAQLGALSLAEDKAFTAASFASPTARWTNSSQPGGADWGLTGSLRGRASIIPGGVPVVIDNQLIGAIGVSGAASSIDHDCAMAAIESVGLGVEP